MPVPMPYYLEKGPFFAVLEDYLNSGPRARSVTVLKKLRNGDGWETFEVLGSKSLSKGYRNADAWAKHLYKHWFGMKKNPTTGKWEQPEFKKSNPQTGYWQGYYGDVDKITRQTLIRTLEVALGVEHADHNTGPIKPTRRWKIEFFWKCSQAWFEGWVTWRRHGKGLTQGQVTVVFATPPVAGSKVLTSPLAGRQSADYREDPKTPIASKQGMWVVTHTHNLPDKPVAATTTSGTASGQWPSPLPGQVHATGAVVTVAPSMADGGVLAHGLKYVPAGP